jgi:hypothetical protein
MKKGRTQPQLLPLWRLGGGSAGLPDSLGVTEAASGVSLGTEASSDWGAVSAGSMGLVMVSILVVQVMRFRV